MEGVCDDQMRLAYLQSHLAQLAQMGLIGNAIAPGSVKRVLRRQLPKSARCPRCGRYLLSKTGCDCKKG